MWYLYRTMKKDTHKRVKVVGAQIKAVRLKRGLTLPLLAINAGISKGNLSKIEAHGSNLSVDTLFRLADALKINPCLLLP